MNIVSWHMLLDVPPPSSKHKNKDNKRMIVKLKDKEQWVHARNQITPLSL